MTLRFDDFKYVRPDIEEFSSKYRKLVDDFRQAGSAEEQADILINISRLGAGFQTMAATANVRYTVNTKDEFYSDEHDFFDSVKPALIELDKLFKSELLKSRFKDELEAKFGNILFKNAEILLKTFEMSISDLLIEESKLTNEYLRLIASASIVFDGKDMNIAGIEPLIQSPDRETRRRASEAKWKFFADNEEKFDKIYDNLVKVRTSIAKQLGYDNFVQLAYDRMKRVAYGPAEVKRFRENVKDVIVPETLRLYAGLRERLGLEKLYYYDTIDFPEGNPSPKGDPEWIVERAGKMYEELSPETSDFIRLMIEGKFMDLYNKPGKSAGGYCTFLPDLKSPFIFANMNGTSHDIRVLTHEAGHAFQAYVCRDIEIPELRHATAEGSEVHSMAMEYVTWPWMKLFFEEDERKFLYHHLVRAIKFIPYGVSIDEFQHFVYENPEATPEERKKKWREIEMTYSPQLDYNDNEFLNGGGYWFHQQHVFRMPFYYIDYCLAQVCALQFWHRSQTDSKRAWEDYLRLCKEGGKRTFLELLKVAEIDSPFEKQTLRNIIAHINEWTAVNEITERNLSEAE